jgi:tetrahydromethanopterin S-methyltransferase subunit A
VFRPKQYDCLGCQVCYPAVAANAFADAFPTEAESLDSCPTDEPAERRGWPPLAGDYHAVRYRAPVAVCTLNSAELANRLAGRPPEGLAIAGTLHTENLGIERIIQNVLANPNIRFLILAGPDTEQAVGHLPGQSLVSLFEKGLDDRGRIVGARGKRPVLKNVRQQRIEAFLTQVELVAMIGEENETKILHAVRDCASRTPGPFKGAPEETRIQVISASVPGRLVLDPAGFLVLYPDAARGKLIAEHYGNDGVLGCVIEGATASAVYGTVIERGLVTRLDHAAYLGRELARAERALETGEPYVQDRAAGETSSEPEPPRSGCGSGCGSEEKR